MEVNQQKTDIKKRMTNDERLALAAKLDEELNDFIAGLEKKRYTDGWPEDRWQEEMEKHPFFMTKLPEGETLPPLLEGIQQLKYDENENTPLELAKSYKEDGNFNFKHKKYRMAILSYTEGIRKKCGDLNLEAELFSNRSAAHFFLGNFRSCLKDCQAALERKPNYFKAQLRALQCCSKLNMFDEAINYANEIFKFQPKEPKTLKIISEVEEKKKIQERDNRKQKLKKKKVEAEMTALLTAIKDRKITIEVDGNIMESLQFSSQKPLLENSILHWPVFFLYPEYMTSDYIEQFNENSTFFDHLNEMFSEPPPWDTFVKYQPDSLSIYYEGADKTELYSVNINSTLSEILSNGRFIVRDWKPSFLVLVKGSKAEFNFLKNFTLITI